MHRDALGLLDRDVAQRMGTVEEAAQAAGVEWNVAKTSPAATSLLLYEDFAAAPFPALLASNVFDPVQGRFKRTEYSRRANPPILHRKELLLADDDPRCAEFERLTQEAEAAGLYDPPLTAIGTRSGWRERMREKNVAIEGARIVATGSGEPRVRRERTAIKRFGPSQPLSAMLRTGMIAAGTSFFDYGCGYGDDVAFLRENEFAADGWDPWHRSDAPIVEADVVALSFVINVIEDPVERIRTAERAWALASKGICVAVMPRGAYDVAGHVAIGDGFVSSRGTFQRYFGQDEIVEFVAGVTGERPVPLGNGVVAAFRDKDLEQQVLSRARSGREHGDEMRPTGRRRASEEAQARSVARAKRAGKAVAAVASLVLDLGRMPGRDELPPVNRPAIGTLDRRAKGTPFWGTTVSVRRAELVGVMQPGERGSAWWRDQARFLKRQDSFPVSMISQ